jgi:hypothetical protein
MTALSLNNGRVDVVAGRAEVLTWSARINGSDGKTQEAMAVADHVRFKIAATRDGTPVLDLSSGGTASNGSTCTIVSRGSSSALATGTIILARGDTASLFGQRYFELIHVDVSEAAHLQDKIICRGELYFLDEQGGSVGAP